MKTKVKICGITNLEDAQVAVEAGADLLGFIFFEPSPRYVAPDTVKKIVSSIKQQWPGGESQMPFETSRRSIASQHGSRINRPLFVGVFVNTSHQEVEQTVNDCDLDAVQLHGEEPPEFVDHFKGRAFKALRPKSKEEANRLAQRYSHSPNLKSSIPGTPELPHFLLDAYHPTLYGGTGHVTDWTMAATVAQQHSIMLAGSLTPENVVDAIQAVKPWGVDVSSGVEAKKGKKDHQKVRAFLKAVKRM